MIDDVGPDDPAIPLVMAIRSLERDTFRANAEIKALALWVRLTAELDRSGLISGSIDAQATETNGQSLPVGHEALRLLFGCLCDAFTDAGPLLEALHEAWLDLSHRKLGRKGAGYLAPRPAGRRGDRPSSVDTWLAKQTIVELVYYLQGKEGLRSVQAAAARISQLGCSVGINTLKTFRQRTGHGGYAERAKGIGRAARDGLASLLTPPEASDLARWDVYLADKKGLNALARQAVTR